MPKTRKTYCTASMRFEDVKAINDGTVGVESNQPFADISLFKEESSTRLADYATTELNLFTLDGSKTIMEDAGATDSAYWYSEKSKDDCTFETNPVVTITFTEAHTSAGMTFFFGLDYPEEMIIKWYTLYGTELMSLTCHPDASVYVVRAQNQNYGKISIEFTKTRFPRQYVTLQYIVYGLRIMWDTDVITSASVLEEVDITSNELSINTAKISIMDTANDFDIANENGAWKSVQRTQEIKLTEYVDSTEVYLGSFFINKSSFSNNIASFEMVDAIGLMDEYYYYNGDIYTNKKAGVILDDIFASAGITHYTIDSELYDITLNGWLDVQTCREALQMVCFAIGALADDSRQDEIKIYRPDKAIMSTIGTNRKFSTQVTLEEYVSGVSIGYSVYSLADKTSKIYSGILQKGTTKITFKSPYDTSTITATAGTLTEVHTNYLLIYSDTEQECTIEGTKYDDESYSYEVSVEALDAGETENVVEYKGCTLYNTEILSDIAQRLLDYNSMRKTVEIGYVVEDERAGYWSNILTSEGYTVTTLINSQSISLTGGYTSTSKCRGYARVTTVDYFAGNELYTGEKGDILL